MAIYVSVLNGGTNGHTVSGRDFTGIATDFVSQGVVGAIASGTTSASNTGAFGVNQVGSGTTQQTQINPGRCYITATPTSSISQTFQVEDTTGTTLTHSANAGATAYDWVYATLDATKLANPASDASDPLVYQIVRSTSASTQTGSAPTYGILLAVVTVATSYTAITNANISDKRTQSGVTPGQAQVNYSKLLGTIFSGQVSTQANAGTAGGTMSYINLGGIKLLWIVTNAVSGASQTVTLPTSFFTTVTACNATAINMTTTVQQYVSVQSATNTTVTFSVTTAGGGTSAASIFVIGT